MFSPTYYVRSSKNRSGFAALEAPRAGCGQEQVGDSIGYKISGDSKVRGDAQELHFARLSRPRESPRGGLLKGDSVVNMVNSGPGRTKLVYVTTGYLLQAPHIGMPHMLWQVLVNNPEQISSYTHLILDEVEFGVKSWLPT